MTPVRLLWTQSAKAQVREIRTSTLRNRLRRRLLLLRRFPEPGRIVPELGRPDVREVIVGVFRVAYLLTTDAIVIQSVWDARRDFPGSDRAGEAIAEYDASHP